MQIQQERFEDIILELPDLWQKHHEEVSTDKDKKPLSPDVFSYIQYERGNRLVVVTARDNCRLVGYSFFVLQMALHHKAHAMAINDLFFVLPEYRGRFIGGKLIDFSEQILKALGAHEIRMTTKSEHNFGPLLERKGFKETEIVYRKYVGERNG